MTPSAVLVIVTVVVAPAVDRGERIIIAVVDVLGGRRLVIVAVAVNGAHKTAGLRRIANPR